MGDLDRLLLQPPRFFFKQDRDAVADREGELRRVADELLLLAVVDQRRLGDRADEDFQKLRVDGPAAPCVSRSGILFLPVYCSGAEGAFAPASAISVIAISVRARVAWSGDSSSACFSGGPHGLIIESAVTRPAFDARFTLSQSASSSFASR